MKVVSRHACRLTVRTSRHTGCACKNRDKREHFQKLALCPNIGGDATVTIRTRAGPAALLTAAVIWTEDENRA